MNRIRFGVVRPSRTFPPKPPRCRGRRSRRPAGLRLEVEKQAVFFQTTSHLRPVANVFGV